MFDSMGDMIILRCYACALFENPRSAFNTGLRTTLTRGIGWKKSSTRLKRTTIPNPRTHTPERILFSRSAENDQLHSPLFTRVVIAGECVALWCGVICPWYHRL